MASGLLRYHPRMILRRASIVVVGTLAAAGLQGAARAAAVTFAKDVAPLFNANCVSCHQPGEVAPMSLTTYDAARPWARSIRKAVAERAMPPWYAAPGVGEFANDPRLSEKDVATIV